VARPQLRKPLCGAVTLTIRFFFARPQSHYGRNAKHELLPTAPGPHITRPDIDNLVKAVKDSLTKIIWEDDSQVVQEFATKEYTSGRERTEIEISFVDY
jgi:Holliday junction resolvase RusA-like endonuclease